MEEKTIFIVKELSPSLFRRDSADKFFDSLEKISIKRIVIDFSGVESITRSFAHQFIIRQNKSKKTVKLENVPINVSKMFTIAKSPSLTTKAVDWTKAITRPLSISMLS